MLTERWSFSFNLLWIQMEAFLLHVVPQTLGMIEETKQEVEVYDTSVHDTSYNTVPMYSLCLCCKLELLNSVLYKLITQVS